MRLCAHCHRREAYGATSSSCRSCHRDYMRDYRGPARIPLKTKALAWLRVAPRTTRQLAELLGVSRQLVASLVWQWRQAGLIRPLDVPRRGQAGRWQVM